MHDVHPARVLAEEGSRRDPHGDEAPASVSLGVIVREWGRIGCIGFGGPPAHIALFRDLCVKRRGWLTDAQFERAIAATNLLPGPASTQLAIYCAWRLRGPQGALIGGLCFILPGLVLILALSALFLAGSPPSSWIRGAGMGAGAAVAAVAVRAGLGVAAPIWRRSGVASDLEHHHHHRRRQHQRPRVLAYALAGGIAAATAGPWLVLVLLACGAIELGWQQRWLTRDLAGLHAWPLLAVVAEPGGAGALIWTALKVGALAFGVWPRATSLVVYAVLGWSLLVEVVGGVGALNHWVLDSSVFHQMATAPAVSPNWATAAARPMVARLPLS